MGQWEQDRLHRLMLLSCWLAPAVVTSHCPQLSPGMWILGCDWSADSILSPDWSVAGHMTEYWVLIGGYEQEHCKQECGIKNSATDPAQQYCVGGLWRCEPVQRIKCHRNRWEKYFYSFLWNIFVIVWNSFLFALCLSFVSSVFALNWQVIDMFAARTILQLK